MTRLLLIPAILSATACGRNGDNEPTVDPIEEGCFHVAEGELIDAGETPDDAPLLTAGLAPYRIGLYPDQVSWVRVSTDSGTLVLMTDADELFASLATEGADVTLPDPYENPTCPQDLPDVIEVQVSSGEHLIGIGPHYKATAWVLVALK